MTRWWGLSIIGGFLGGACGWIGGTYFGWWGALISWLLSFLIGVAIGKSGYNYNQQQRRSK